MLKKIYQADFLLLPEHEFWNMYIPLTKGQRLLLRMQADVQKIFQIVEGSITMNMPVSRLDGQVLSVK